MSRDRDNHKSAEDRPASTDAKDAHHLTDQEYEQAVRTSKGLRAVQKTDIKARILGISQKGGMVEIAIGSGSQQGIEDGMEGVFSDERGQPMYDFRVYDVSDRLCRALLPAPNHDIITRSPNVVVNPSNKKH